MNLQTQLIIDKFLRRCCKNFTARDVSRLTAEFGGEFKISSKEAQEYLESSPLVFCLENGRYITRAGVFTGELFSIKPTAKEFDQRILIPGSRCIPFVDSEIVSSTLNFYDEDNKKLKKKTADFDSDLAIDMFILYGEEYAPQYIVADPANKDLDFVQREFELPNTVHLTGIDITPFIEKYGMQKGDRFLCCVSDWDRGDIRMTVVHDGDNVFNRGLEGSMRLEWYKTLESALQRSFDIDGPCACMEDQLANVFCREIERLCIPLCGSIEEFINQYAQNVGIQPFGVESRFWHKGKDVPAVGSWNEEDLDRIEQNPAYKGKDFLWFHVPPEIVDQYIINMHFKRKVDIPGLVSFMFPKDYVFQEGEKEDVLLKLKERSDIISKKYNWFADQDCGEVREKALGLFSKVNELVFSIDSSSDSMGKFPQQELVVLTQLYSHLVRILHSVAENDHVEEDRAALLLSLEGMEWNFEDICDVLREAVRSQKTNRFKIVR